MPKENILLVAGFSFVEITGFVVGSDTVGFVVVGNKVFVGVVVVGGNVFVIDGCVDVAGVN